MKLSESQVQAFQKDGYLVSVRLLLDEELNISRAIEIWCKTIEAC